LITSSNHWRLIERFILLPKMMAMWIDFGWLYLGGKVVEKHHRPIEPRGFPDDFLDDLGRHSHSSMLLIANV
jgi:hypothetical protein